MRYLSNTVTVTNLILRLQVRGHLQTDFGTLNVIILFLFLLMTLGGFSP